MVKVNEDKCVGCANCVPYCPEGAIWSWGVAEINQKKCTECNVCIEWCPVNAIEQEGIGEVQQRTATVRQKKVDVAIIGAGIGGLTAGALAAKRGYKVLVVEKLPRIGGRYSTMDYKGFALHIGGTGAEMGTDFLRTMRELGVDCDIRPGTVPFKYRIKGEDHELSEKGGMREVLAVCGGVTEADKVMGALRQVMTAESPPEITVREWLLQYTRNELILHFFHQNTTSSLMQTIDEATVADFVYFLKNAHGWRNYGFMVGGPIAMTRGLSTVIQREGGEVWTRCAARKILVEGRRVKGMVVHNADEQIEVSASVVISNAGAWKTVEFAGTENFDNGYLSQIREGTIPGKHIWVQCACDRPLMGPGVLMTLDTKRVYIVFDTSQTCPDHAPAGKYLLQSGALPQNITCVADYKRELDLHLKDLKTLLPDFEKHARVLIASIYRDAWPSARTLPDKTLPLRTPVDLLYNVGDGFLVTRGNTGGPGAVESARWVIQDLMKRS